MGRARQHFHNVSAPARRSSGGEPGISPERRALHYETMVTVLEAAAASPDPSTQNGAAVIDSDGNLAAVDHNRFPDGVADTKERWERPLKYSFIEHAERNAIFRAARSGVKLEGATLVCPWAACADCARAIVQAGFKTLVRLPRAPGVPGAHWQDEVAIGDLIMREAGVRIIELEPSELGATPSLRRNGAPWHA